MPRYKGNPVSSSFTWQRGVEKVAAIAIHNWTFGVAVLLAVLFSSTSLHAQQVNPGTETGMPPYATFSGGSLDHVNVQSGNIHVEIPLFSLKERGRTFTWKFVYDPLSFQRVWDPQPTQQDPGNGTYLTSQVEDVSGWRLTGPLQWNLGYSTQTQTCPTTGVQYTSHTQFYLEDEEGTKHQLPLYEEGDGSQVVCNPQVLSGPSLDGSGIMVSLIPGTSQNWTAIFKDGAQFNPQTGVFSDSNGNMVSAASDMLGRNPVTVTTGQNSASYTFKDSNGNSETYQVQYATYNILTSLCGGTSPYPCTEYTATYSMPIKLILPDQTSYQFSYQNNSELALTEITLPTGGTISYSTAIAGTFQPDQGHHPTLIQRPSVASRTVGSGGTNSQWTYSGTGSNSVAVTDPAGNQQVFQYSKLTIGSNCSASPVEVSESDYQGSASTGTFLRTITKAWTGEPSNINDGPSCGVTLVNLRETGETTTLDSGQVSQVQNDYETFTYDNGTFTATRLNPTEKREYDYGSGTPTRKTDYTYLHTNNQTYLNLNIVDRVASVTTYDGSGTKMAQTINEYDNYTQGIAPTNAVQHSSSFGTGYVTRGNVTAVSKWRNTDGALLTTRNQYNDVGEIISTTDPKNNTTLFDYSDSWSNTACAPAGSAAAYPSKITNALGQITRFTYESCTGAVASSTDVNSQTTAFSYGLFDRPVVTSNPDGGSTSICYTDDPNESCYSSALPLKITTTKALTSGTNLVTTAVLDGLGRVSQTQTNSDPQGIDYVDTTYDGLGRVATVSNAYRSTSDPTYGITTFAYDALGRKTQVTDPDNSVATTAYLGNSITVTDEAGHQRRSFTDALGRLTEVDEPGGSSSGPGTFSTGSVTINGSEKSKSVFPPGCHMRSCAETIYDSGTVLITVNGFSESASYGQGDTAAGLATVIANEFNGAGSSSPVTASVSGNVISFRSSSSGANTNYSLSGSSSTNDPSDFGTPSFTTSTSGPTLTGGTGGSGGISPLSLSTPYQTFYSYNALGNLLQVQQKGNDANSADWRTRSFTYNSLSQLLTSTNPETGAASYTYDNNGNVATKTDARGVTITNGYDALNRVTSVTYSNGDPSVTYTYDQSNCLGQTSCHNIGRRTSMTDAAGSEAWSYDLMGRVLADQRTSGVTKITTYTYSPYLDGSINSITYPSGLTITYSYDSVGRPVSAIDQNGVKYAASASYGPQGAVSSAVIGVSGAFNGITVTSTYNKRLQPVEIKASSSVSTPLDLSYNFNLGAGDNGTVAAITNNVDSTRSQVFTYDALNRLVVAGTQSTSGTNCWGEEYSYDAWANLFQISPPAGYTGCTVETLSLMVSTNNQAGGFSYDGAGNVANDTHNAYTWNAESEVKTAAGVTYSYDGLGNRVEKSNGTLYWFGMGSEALEETDLSGNLKNDYVFFGGKRIARHTASANYYYVEDHLGSSRVITDSSGNKCYDADFYPFGGELTFTNTCAQNYKFTGKERDAETGNDNLGARYYSSSFGRFLSPDRSAIPEPVPYANLTNPQTLNLYQYVEDDPETFADLDGHTDSGENGQNNNKSAQTSTTTCGQAALDATGGCTTTKVDANHPAQQQSGYTEDNGITHTLTISQTTTTQVVNQNGTITQTSVTTNASWSTAHGQEETYLGATQATSTTVFGPGMTSVVSSSSSSQSISSAAAFKALGASSWQAGAAFSAPDRAAYFVRAVGSDIRAHPLKYAGIAAEAGLMATPVPEAYEGAKAVVDVGLAAAHLAWDLIH